ncbi:hypothetical protein LNTAR_06259 [Lentisphaera araneosa HTCC2155]|jgi:hypothetical protein|uniref:YcxB-like protein domain-containing protein n=1 Tax=Lentisphaera araneosa HTCC2155 TaxID=313628 RepID=A6DN78_9BACT|nr:YcxB family protein [Lentisphaera araneosa]EDM26826.1 hypothetical protein LNTAR_06259 [Lentisphaera araneosa HTCC2155]
MNSIKYTYKENMVNHYLEVAIPIVHKIFYSKKQHLIISLVQSQFVTLFLLGINVTANPNDPFMIPYIMLGILSFIFFYKTYESSQIKAIKKLTRKQLIKRLGDTIEIQIDEEYIMINKNGQSTRFTSSASSNIVEDSHYLILLLNGEISGSIPKEVLTQEQITEIKYILTKQSKS